MNWNPCQEIPAYFDEESPLSMMFPSIRSSASAQPDNSFSDESDEE